MQENAHCAETGCFYYGPVFSELVHLVLIIFVEEFGPGLFFLFLFFFIIVETFGMLSCLFRLYCFLFHYIHYVCLFLFE